MPTDRRNPYLILGVDFGTHRAQASRHFAQAVRRLKSTTDSPYTIEDLTWALSQVEHYEADPAQAVDIFRVPADHAVFSPPGPGLLQPPPIAMDRSTPEDDPEAVASLTRSSAIELLQASLSVAAPITPSPAPYFVTSTS